MLWSKFSVPYTFGAAEEGNLWVASGWAQCRTGCVLLKWTRMEVVLPCPGWDWVAGAWACSTVTLGLPVWLQWLVPRGHGMWVFLLGPHPMPALVPPWVLGSQAGRSAVVLPAWEGLICRKLPCWETFLRPLLAPHKQWYTLWWHLCWISSHTAQPTVYHVTIYKLLLKLHK